MISLKNILTLNAFKIFSAALLLSVITAAGADTTTIENGCVKYMETGKSFNIQLNIIDGKDLWPKYSWANVLTKYAVVFWNTGEATVIDISVFGLIMDTGVDGVDLQGRRWKVAKQPWCF